MNNIDEGRLFTGCAILALVISILLGLSLWIVSKSIDMLNYPLLDRWIFGKSDGVALFNLWVDIIVGVLTIWSLRWAARKFAEQTIQPDISLLLGRITKRDHSGIKKDSNRPCSYKIMTKKPFRVYGWENKPLQGNPTNREPHIFIPLHLKNRNSKAGRYVTVELRIQAIPSPTSMEFIHFAYVIEENVVKAKQDKSDTLTLSIPFKENLILYQKQIPSYIGKLVVNWGKTLVIEELPKNIILEYDVYTLDGASGGVLEIEVDWTKASNG